VEPLIRIAYIACALSASACLTRPTGPAGTVDATGGSSDGAIDGPPPPHNIMFVTSGVFGPPWAAGAPGGHSATADAFCGSRAQQAGLLGNYVAWLSYGDGTNAVTRLRGLPFARNWYRPDGVFFAASVDDLVTYPLAVAPTIDETTRDVTVAEPSVEVATGTAADGTYDGGTAADCPAGSIEIGYPGHTDSSWTAGGQVPCSTSMNLRLYCFSFGAPG
jgi:hypothetical protein